MYVAEFYSNFRLIHEIPEASHLQDFDLCYQVAIHLREVFRIPPAQKLRERALYGIPLRIKLQIAQLKLVRLLHLVLIVLRRQVVHARHACLLLVELVEYSTHHVHLLNNLEFLVRLHIFLAGTAGHQKHALRI